MKLSIRNDIALCYRRSRATAIRVFGQNGVEELSKEKLNPLLRLKYHDSIAEAVADLGKPDEIGKVFAGFQRHLYDKATLRPT